MKKYLLLLFPFLFLNTMVAMDSVAHDDDEIREEPVEAFQPVSSTVRVPRSDTTSNSRFRTDLAAILAARSSVGARHVRRAQNIVARPRARVRAAIAPVASGWNRPWLSTLFQVGALCCLSHLSTRIAPNVTWTSDHAFVVSAALAEQGFSPIAIAGINATLYQDWSSPMGAVRYFGRATLGYCFGAAMNWVGQYVAEPEEDSGQDDQVEEVVPVEQVVPEEERVDGRQLAEQVISE